MLMSTSRPSGYGPARTAYIGLAKFYGEDDVTREDFQAIACQMQALLYRPGN